MENKPAWSQFTRTSLHPSHDAYFYFIMCRPDLHTCSGRRILNKKKLNMAQEKVQDNP